MSPVRKWRKLFLLAYMSSIQPSIRIQKGYTQISNTKHKVSNIQHMSKVFPRALNIVCEDAKLLNYEMHKYVK